MVWEMRGTEENRKKFLEYEKNFQRRKKEILSLVKWLALAVLVGCVVGVAGSLFSYALSTVTWLREKERWLFLLLPFLGLCIVGLYQRFGRQDGGTNQILSTIRSAGDVSFRSAPLIFVATALTHLGGGSAGREGAALQLGGSISNKIGKLLRMDEADRHMMVMIGMSAAFAALFGTPMAAAFFPMEVVSVGIMYYTALLPCVIAALIASELAMGWGIRPEVFHVTEIPELTLETGGKLILVALGCALVSILFCSTLKWVGRIYGRLLKNPYVRVAVAGGIIILLTILLQTDDYMGAGTNLIIQAVEQGKANPFAFFWKLLLTALTMRAGFRGGEIVPAFCVGATFGCVAGQLIGLSPSLCAAAGMTAVFCGVTNCPISSILIAFELFGFSGEPFYLIAVAISYAASGNYSLYREQRIVYSKYKARYVNDRAES